MKPIFLLALLLGSLFASAQDHDRAPLREPDYNKPLLFSESPASAAIQPQQFDHLFLLSVGDTLSTWLTPALRLRGVVTSRDNGNDKELRSVVIRATNGAVFNLSRRTGREGSEYNGRLLSYNHGDAFELVAENGKYHLQKRSLYDLLSE